MPPPPPRRSNASTAWLSVLVGMVVLGAALGYKWHVDRQNEEVLRKSKDMVVVDRPPIHYGTGDPDAVPARLPEVLRRPEDAFADGLKNAETLADQGEFAAALDALAQLAMEFPKRAMEVVGPTREIESLVAAACEEAEARARQDPVKGADALEDLAGRVPTADAARLSGLRDQLRRTAGKDAAQKRLRDADQLEKDGKLDEAVLALLEASRGLAGDESGRALSRAAKLLQRARYEGVVRAERLAKLDLPKLDAVERAVERALAAAEGKDADDALRQLEALPDADPELVAAVILRGGTPVDAPTGEAMCEHTLPGGGKRRYAVSVPDGGLPTRPRPLVLFLEPGAGSPEQARGVARGWRQSLDDKAIVACGIPDQDCGWGPNRQGEEHVGALLADLRKRHLFDPDRVVLVGKSAGAHGVWFQAMRYGDRFSACVGVAGTPYSPMYGSHWMDWISNLHLAPGRALVGAKDEVFPVGTARRFADIAREKGCNVTVTEFPGRGHEGASMEDVRKEIVWALEQKRDTHPKKLAWSTDSPVTGRCAWVEIAELSKGAGQLTVNFVNDFGQTVESRRISKDCARIEAVDGGQTIELTTLFVKRLRLLWDAPRADNRPPVITLNGMKCSGLQESRGVRVMIQEARRAGRRDRVVWGVTEIAIPD